MGSPESLFEDKSFTGLARLQEAPFTVPSSTHASMNFEKGASGQTNEKKSLPHTMSSLVRIRKRHALLQATALHCLRESSRSCQGTRRVFGPFLSVKEWSFFVFISLLELYFSSSALKLKKKKSALLMDEGKKKPFCLLSNTVYLLCLLS